MTHTWVPKRSLERVNKLKLSHILMNDDYDNLDVSDKSERVNDPYLGVSEKSGKGY